MCFWQPLQTPVRNLKIMPVSIQIFLPEIQIIRLISVLLLTMLNSRDIIVVAFTILKTDDLSLDNQPNHHSPQKRQNKIPTQLAWEQIIGKYYS